MQRLGRTGRKRSGSCVALCTAGAEVAKFRRAMAAHKTISTSLKRDLRSFQMFRCGQGASVGGFPFIRRSRSIIAQGIPKYKDRVWEGLSASLVTLCRAFATFSLLFFFICVQWQPDHGVGRGRPGARHAD